MINGPELDPVFQERQTLIDEVVSGSRSRGMKLDEYVTGVIYDPSGQGWGHTVSMGNLEPQPIYITASAWKKAGELGITLAHWIEQALDHELLHNVLRNRAKRELVPAFSTQPLEAIAYGQQLTEKYLQSKRSRFSEQMITIMHKTHSVINKNEYRGQLEKLSRMKGPHAVVFTNTLKIVDREIPIDEYYEALGIL